VPSVGRFGGVSEQVARARIRCAIILVVGVSFGGGTRGVWVLCKRAPATHYPHHSVGVLVARYSRCSGKLTKPRVISA
jgi:hypothetical protein